ncbi:MAG: 2-oxo acid dehydrogenase subunit E2, partial [bacterium]
MHEIRIPRLGWSMEQGTFLRWLKNHGDPVKKGEALFELEGDKNVQEIESVEAGILNIPQGSPFPGATVDVGTLLGYLVNDGEIIVKNEIQPENKTSDDKPQSHAGPAARRMAAELGLSLNSITGTGRSGLITKEDVSSAAEMQLNYNSAVNFTESDSNKVATPRARRLALENQLDWKTLVGTGKGGRIRESDVVSAIKSQTHESHLVTQNQGTKLSPRRRAIAGRLRLSQQKTVPVTLHSRADVTELVALRDRLKLNSPGTIPSYNDLICALLPRILKLHPQMAQIWDQDHEGLVACHYEDINIGMAVDTSSGLLVPVIRNVAGKTLSQISTESRRLIDLARSGNLQGDAMRG